MRSPLTPMHGTARPILLAALVLALAACGRGITSTPGEAPNLEKWIAEVKARPAPPLDPLPVMQQFETFEYAAQALRDPFSEAFTDLSGGSGPRPDPSRPKQTLEQFPLDSLDMVGTLGGGAGLVALVMAPDKVTYRVRPGAYLGQSDGRVTGVFEDRIELVELVPDGAGGWLERPSSVSLEDNGLGYSTMTVSNAERSNAKRLRPARRPMSMRVGAIGLAIGLLTAFSAVDAAQSTRLMMAQSGIAPASSLDPAKQLPGAISVSNIDFKRGDGGAGRLSLRFNGAGAAPDLRTEGSTVVIDVGNAQLPASLQKPLNVTDFATPVQRIDARPSGGGTKLVLSTSGPFESLAYQSGNEYVVEIVPRAAQARATGATSAMGATASSGSARAYSGRPVTFNFQDVPVRTVLQLIAEESNLNLVASDTVSGNVTLRLINVPWDQALDIVLRAKGLDKRRDGSVIWVAPQKELADYEQNKEDARIAIETRAEMVTEYIPINYGNAEDIAKLLTEESKTGSGGAGAGAGNQQRGFLSARGSMSFDRRTNTLLVIDIPQKVTEIKRLVSLLDKPVDQVLIEARIVIATESFARELGAKFGIAGYKDHVLFNGDVAANTTTGSSLANTARANSATPPPNPLNIPTITKALNVNLPVVNAAGSLALSLINAGYMLDIELSALQTEGRGEVISNPRIVTSNQKEAIIRQGKEVGYVTVTGGQSNSIPTVQFKDVLLELKVTPTITHDGRVFLNMAVKKDEIDGFVTTGVGSVPQINKREVTTAVLVNDGQTVVIGGVYEFSDRSELTKVPFLGDLPFIGNLFKKKGRSKEKAELLIFVTPKVMEVAQR